MATEIIAKWFRLINKLLLEFIMSRLVSLLLLLAFTISSPAFAKDKESSVEKATKDEVRGDDYSKKGKGRPNNPGEHGRENAADKQSRGQGNGSKKEESWEDRIRDEIDDGGKGKGNKKDKGKKK
jgi:hypothetical protein